MNIQILIHKSLLKEKSKYVGKIVKRIYWFSVWPNYLLNVFTDYNYSNSLMSRVCLTKVKIWIKLYRIRTQATIFPFVNIILEQNKTLVSICVGLAVDK